MSFTATRRDMFPEMVTDAAKLLPDWKTFPNLAGDPEALFADEVGRDVDVRMEPGGNVTVTNWLPDGTQHHEPLADVSPEGLVAAITRVAKAYDDVDPARAFLNQALEVIAEPRTVEWRHRSAQVEWSIGNGWASLSIGRAANGQHVRALVHLNFRNLSVENATPIVVAATADQPAGEAEGAGRAAQPLVKAAPALWLSNVLKDEETGGVERAELTVDDVRVTVTTGRYGRPATVDVGVTTWVGLDRIIAILAAVPRA
ncbi:hypothetical protein ABT033_31425 [Streptomyces pharetrae]|uniref:hypothetical protein n=1 Tax=Streptomyces pharetrae TaxID=291370 RepID=UPI003350942B